MIDLPAWLQFVLTVIGSATSGFLGGVLSFSRRIRSVEDRVAKLEQSVGTETGGGGLYGRFDKLQEQLAAMEERAEQRHEFLRARIHELGGKTHETITEVQTDIEGRIQGIERSQEERGRLLLADATAAAVAAAKAIADDRRGRRAR